MSRFIDALGEVNLVLLCVTLAAVSAACWTRWENWLEKRRKESSRLG